MRYMLLPLLVCLLASCASAIGLPPPADAASSPASAAIDGQPVAAGGRPALTASAAPVVLSASPSATPSAASVPSPDPCAPTKSKSTIGVAGRTIPVDLAWTAADRAHGLSGRPCLARGTGLVIGWDAPTTASIWMPDMNFAIDVFFVRDGRIVAIFADAQPCKPGERCPTFGPGVPVDYVLEVPAGSAKEWGAKKDDPITLVK